MALSADKTRVAEGAVAMSGSCPVAANTTIYCGSLVAVVSGTGYAIPAATATTHLVLGVATKKAVAGAVAGSATVSYETGVFELTNGDAIAQADVGRVCYVTDDDTVTKANVSQSKAGIIVGVTATGVLVRLGVDMLSP